MLSVLPGYGVIPVKADDGTPDPLKAVAFDQRLNAQIPLDLIFKDETGRSVRLGNYFGKGPVILQFAYYDCPMLCNLVFRDLAKTIDQLGLQLGDAFQILTVSIDPGEGSELAGNKKAALLEDTGLQESADAWHFLTGDQTAIEELTKTAGFRFSYDPKQDQYAHPAGVIVLTPQGKISRYFFGIDFPATELRLGLVEASDRRIGTPVDQFFLLCYHYDPVTGRYNLLINNVIRIAGLFTVLVVSGLVLILLLKERRSSFHRRTAV